jgi:hypothetical protein
LCRFNDCSKKAGDDRDGEEDSIPLLSLSNGGTAGGSGGGGGGGDMGGSLLGSGSGSGAATPGVGEFDDSLESPLGTSFTSSRRHRSIVNSNSSVAKTIDAMLKGAADEEMLQMESETLLLQESGGSTGIEGQVGSSSSSSSSGIPKTPKFVHIIQSSEVSSILNDSQMNTIGSFLSPTDALKSWQLSYSLRQHGANLTTLLACSNKKSASGQRLMVPCIVVIEDSWGYIFGGFVSPCLRDKSSYYGNGECFVFSVVPTPRAYKWTGKNDLFVMSNDKGFAMGGGGDGFAIHLDDELDTGVSNCSATFENPVLSSSEFFKCLNVEVWTLDAGFAV